jgi:hypothetical protein
MHQNYYTVHPLPNEFTSNGNIYKIHTDIHVCMSNMQAVHSLWKNPL